ncbi:MAG: FAD-binding domain-containing protein [Chromatiales bacterium]|jgi:deoxyribodipyrimidine photo-lyase
MIQVVWFKRDLRVHDNEALTRAAEQGPVLPLYIVEPDLWRQPDSSSRHWTFCRESLLSLREALADLGQPLVIRQGPAVTVLREMVRSEIVGAVWSHSETGNGWSFARDKAVAAMLAEEGIPWYQPAQHGVVRGYCDRDAWSKQWERMMARERFRSPWLIPLRRIDPGTLPGLPFEDYLENASPDRQAGGRKAAIDALDSFLEDRGSRYHMEMSSPLTAGISCSRISSHLAFGTLSMREAVHATRRRRASVKQLPPQVRGSWPRALSAFEGRLHWHCHFMQKLESEPRIEFENMQRSMNGLREQETDLHRLESWMRGETGWPLVDACMRALRHTGWLNFRMRAMLVSVASYQLWLHWRLPSLHLARLFTDYEPGIHYSQVQMQSGTTGINSLRIYNPVKQSMEQDPNGDFIKHWLPELEGVKSAWIHAPWLMPDSEQKASGVIIDSTYPSPLVDHEAAARHARSRMLQARRQQNARHESREILERHGSRRRRPSRSRQQSAQGDLFGNDA